MRQKAISLLVSLFFIMAAFLPLSLHAQENSDFPEGSLWQMENDQRVYVIINGRKHEVPSPAVFTSYGWDWKSVKAADPDLLFGIPDIRVIKTADNDNVYDITTGKRALMHSAEEFLERGFIWDEIAVVSKAELESYALLDEGPAHIDTTVPPPATTGAAESVLLKKISEARALLASAPPIYPQEHAVTSTIELKLGKNGAEVKALQEKLKELGFFPKKTAANGNFGPATDKAVRAFQKANKLAQVGVVGPQTKKALAKKGLSFDIKGTTKKQWRDTVPEERQVLLAAWNEGKNDIKLVRVDLVPQRVKVGKVYRTVSKAVSQTSGFVVHYKSGSGVNVNYDISSPAGWKVLANRFPIFDEPQGSIGTFPPSEEIYVPYSDSLKTPEIVAAGRDYLDTTVSQALADLRAKGVRSASGRGLVAVLTDPDELKNIAIIEHLDHMEFRATDDKQGVINKVFSILGTNKEEAYRFAGSSAGALGLAQFIRNTYAAIRRDYPAAQLIENFEDGMANHVNALKAMSLYHDVTGATLESYAQGTLATAPNDLAFVLAEVRAAAYNGGASRVRLAIKKFGQNWDSATGGLRAETKAYLEKFRIVRQILKTS